MAKYRNNSEHRADILVELDKTHGRCLSSVAERGAAELLPLLLNN